MSLRSRSPDCNQSTAPDTTHLDDLGRLSYDAVFRCVDAVFRLLLILAAFFELAHQLKDVRPRRRSVEFATLRATNHRHRTTNATYGSGSALELDETSTAEFSDDYAVNK
jgi:hypothetical protein